jgi:ADP-heptose:LPS heptosyltransferase
LRSAGITARPALILPGSGSPAKNWPAENFAALALRLESRLQVAIALGPAEPEALQSFFITRRCRVLTNLELGELAGTAASAAIFIGNDSGVSHLAAAAGARGIALFGPTDPDRWRPLGRVEVLAQSPLAALEVADVASAAEVILDLPS